MASNKKAQTAPITETEDSQVTESEAVATITTDAATEESNQDSVENAAETGSDKPSVPETTLPVAEKPATVRPAAEKPSSGKANRVEAKVVTTTADIEPPTPKATPNIHERLTKLVRSITPHAGQEKVFALHQLELLTGRLKMVIPAAIAATDDSALRADLTSLLGLL